MIIGEHLVLWISCGVVLQILELAFIDSPIRLRLNESISYKTRKTLGELLVRFFLL